MPDCHIKAKRLLHLKTRLHLLTGIFILLHTAISFAAAPVKTPGFPADAEWINTERPLTMEELRGRIVLLDFWTYCCINCMHILPDLKKLQSTYGDSLVVIGVHSAKFDGEKVTENIRDAVNRYDIRHPVVNDTDVTMCYQLGIKAWPTLVLIDPQGFIVGKVTGEGHYELLDQAIGDLIKLHGVDTDALNQALPLRLERDNPRLSELFYPGKVLADEAQNRLYIADSGNNRILVSTLDTGEIIETVGTGLPRLTDGAFDAASFSNPQGMAFSGTSLYVADTDNHAVRKIDFNTRAVTTIAGTGIMGTEIGNVNEARKTALNSPWDLTILDGVLYIAMAGTHQLWFYDLARETAGILAGSGHEDIADGPLPQADLAQPSGITSDGTSLFFVDSETSAIRRLSLSENLVSTLIGTGLFDFGHRDGPLPQARLQHPLGIAWTNGALYVADTYNNRIKRIDLANNDIVTIAGSGTHGKTDANGCDALFDEPGGLSEAHGKLYIADTNNHAIRVFDLETRDVTTMSFSPATSRQSKAQTFDVRITLPENYHINVAAPSTIEAFLTGTGEQIPLSAEIKLSKDLLVATFPVTDLTETSSVEIRGLLSVCEESEHATCQVWPFSFVRVMNPSMNDPAPGTDFHTVMPPG